MLGLLETTFSFRIVTIMLEFIEFPLKSTKNPEVLVRIHIFTQTLLERMKLKLLGL